MPRRPTDREREAHREAAGRASVMPQPHPITQLLPGRRRTAGGVVVSMCLFALACTEPPLPAPTSITLVLVNARVWTGDPAAPWIEALAVGDGRIVATGTSRDVRLLAPDAKVIDADRRLVLPGFIDSYTRVLDAGNRPGSVPLAGLRSRRQLVNSVRTVATTQADGDWVRGHDWDQRVWGGTIPASSWIDAVTPKHPVWLVHRDRQAGLANTLALSHGRIVAGIQGAATGPDGTLTGILTGAAKRQLEARLPALSPAARGRVLDAALVEAAARGITSIHHVGTWDDLELFLQARRDGRLTLRLNAAVPLTEWMRLDRTIGVGTFGGTTGRGDDRLRVGAVHTRLDGTLASATAAFAAPYLDSSGATLAARPVRNMRSIRPLAISADAVGLQMIVEAVGDDANRAALDLAVRLVAENGPRDRRYRVAHAQHLHPTDVPRFATGRVIASLLPFDTVHEGRWVDQHLGPARARTSFAARSLIDAGASVSFGSGRMTQGSPIDGIYAAVTRRTLDGLHPQGWLPEQRVSVEDAVYAYTTAAAYAGFTEASTGTLTVGRFADFVMVDRDLMSVTPTAIPNASVLLTVVGGEIVHDQLRRSPPEP